jgi:hypothetical protein
MESLQRREERWAIVNLAGKGRHIQTVPVPNWVKETLDTWLAAAGVVSGRYSDVSVGRVNSGGTASRKKQSGTSSRRQPQVRIFRVLHRTISAAPVHDSAMMPAASLSRSSSFLGTCQCKQRSVTSAASSA